MNGLVQKLSQGWHPLVVSVGPERSVEGLREALSRGYIHLKFTNTQGGTEVGVAVDRNRSDVSSADFNSKTGKVTIVGSLILDYVPLQCTATIELPQLDGSGHLEVVPA